MARRRQPALWPLGLLIVLLVGVPVAGWVRGALDRPPTPQAVRPGVAAYRVVYLVEHLAGGQAAVSTERLWVRRPFEGRLETALGEPPGEEATAVVVSDFAVRQRGSSDQAPLVLRVEPSPPEGDLRLAAAIEDAVERGFLTFRDRHRTVLGRRCDVYRTPLRSPSGQLEGDHRDLCVDAQGLVLFEEQTVDGGVIRRREAVALEIAPALDERRFDVTGDPLHVDDGGGAIRRLTDDSRTPEATVYELPAGPEDFHHLGRYAITPATTRIEAGPIPSGTRVVGVLDVWVRGPDFVAVFNGGADDAAAPFGDDPTARAVDLGAAGPGESVVTLTGAEVRADLGEGRFVRVYGTVSLDRLVALARRLEPRTGGGITPIEP